MAETFVRTAPFTVVAMQMTAENQPEAQSWIASQTMVDNWWDYDGEGNLTVKTGDSTITTIHVGDYFYFYELSPLSRYWFVDNPADFAAAFDLPT